MTHLQIRARQRVARLMTPLSRRLPIRLGALRRTTPLSDHWGFDRGTPIDRYYIESFLDEHRGDITGRVLEVMDSGYTDRFGARVEHRDVLDIDATNPAATIVADLTVADAIPADRFDCFILTQTLQFIYDTRAAIAAAQRALRPGGVLLVTVPAVSRIARLHSGSDYWRFTPASCSLLFGEAFGPANVQVRSYGNVLAAIGFLTGLAREELTQNELDSYDEYFPVIVAVRATRQ